MPAVQDLPDPDRHHPRHHGRCRRQPDDGARGADAGKPVDRDGGAQQRRHRDRAGRAHRRARLAPAAAGEGAGRARRLRGGGRAGAPLADLPYLLQPGLLRRDARAGEHAGADGAERAQGHRTPRGDGTARQLGRQPGHRHARGHCRGGQRGAHRRSDDADRRARRGRRHPGRRPGLRGRDQHAGGDRPALPVRLLRRRRARPRLPGPGAGRRARQPQRQQVRAAPGRRGRFHQHQPGRQARGLRRHLQRRRRGDGGGAGVPEDPAGGPHTQVRARGRAPHLQWPSRRAARPAGAVHHRALRAAPVRAGAGTDRDRAGHRPGARRAGADGLRADHARAAEDDGRAAVRTRPDGTAPGPAAPAARAAFPLRRAAGHLLRQLRGPHGARRCRRAGHPRCRGAVPGDRAAQGAGDHRLRQLPRCAAGHRRLLRHGARAGAARTTAASRATPPAPSCVSSWAKRCAAAAWHRTSSKAPRRRARTSTTTRPRSRLDPR